MKILGVDQSFTSCGIVIIEDGQLVYEERFVSCKTLGKPERAYEVAKRLAIVALKNNVDAVALEGLAFGGKGNATRDLAGLQFAILIELGVHNGYECEIIGIGTAKKLACGKGNAGKEVLVESLPKYVRERFDALGVKKTTGLGDLSDAYWIGMVLYNRIVENTTK